VPIVALVDTNCDPDEADFIIPGNDDAIRSCSLIVRAIADGIAAGQTKVTEKEMTAATNGNGAGAQGAPGAEPEAEAAAPAEVAAETEAPAAAAVEAEAEAEADVVAPEEVDVPAAGQTEEETA
jgi:small subunit ribosomal protein S2